MNETTRIFRPQGPFAALFGKPYGPTLAADQSLSSSPLSTLFHALSIPPRDALLAHKRKRPVPPPAS
ncbi:MULTISPECIES: hypothetical protein [Pseudomonas]|uniref:Uncharacterized protein n=1 Tax=Pseudomonas sp. Hg7Tf TaxID=3236988 RepID=A0AB39I1S6_9PSED|nr:MULTISPECIES: hypothetical protein [Pseudomonas]KJK09435.1 hypothetical protein UB47_02540 [Pseudomonas sp. 5]MDD1976496.1 hypothetical protein [Pseudomonas putida]QYX46703.1 hypothetical protein K3F43_18660 [Pseudomonas sp. S11A 273]